MAEESGGAGWWGSWGSELLSSVRDKSAEALNMVKQDLSEFVSTIQHDTSAVVADTATAVKESLKVEEEESEATSARFKQGVSKFLGTLSNSLRENISHVTAAAAVTSDGPEPVFDRMQARLHEIQTDPSTFCSEPDGHFGMYEEWCKTFDPEQHKGEISELLVNVPEIRALYAKLVPSAVSHILFWQRYFYKVHQLEQEEKKRAALVARANQAEDEELGWGDDDLWDTEEAGVESVLNKHVEGSKDVVLDKRSLTRLDGKELMNEVSDQGKSEQTEAAKKSPTAVEKQEKIDGTTGLNKDTSEETRERDKLELKENKETLREDAAKLSVSKRTEQIPLSQETKPEITNVQQKDPSTSEVSNLQTADRPSDAITSHELQTATHKRDNSSGSLDSSWSKLSEANSDKEGSCSREKITGSGHSSSSSSGVLVPSVDDKDVDWDEDLDLDADDMSEEEVKRIMENMAANKQGTGNQEDADVDDDDWENWD